MRGRVTFTIAGKHPLLLLVRDYLIQEKKYALVPWSSDPAFCLYGAALSKDETLYDGLHRASLEASQVRKIPTVILSTSSMYAMPGDPGSYQELDGYHAVAPCDRKALFSLSVESMLLGEENLVVRPMNVYGPDITTGVIPRFIEAAKKKENLPVRGNGYQTRSFIHQDDFLEEFGSLLGEIGTHTIGTTSDISINRLADSIWRAVHGPDVPTKVEFVDYPQKDSDGRAKNPKDTGKEYMSLRKGVWLLLQ